jgi:uncharacterized protein YbjQ (UPF0145 family)
MTDEVERWISDLETGSSQAKKAAAEALAKLDYSNERITLALKKVAEQGGNPYDGSLAAIEAAQRALQVDIHKSTRLAAGHLTAEEQQAAEAAAIERIIITTTPVIDGRTIDRYCGIISAEVVLGTGFFSELNAGIADTFGIRSGSFQNKLRNAKNNAIRELKIQAVKEHADAVIGVDFEYATLSENLLMIVAVGTAVTLDN